MKRGKSRERDVNHAKSKSAEIQLDINCRIQKMLAIKNPLNVSYGIPL